MRRRCQASVVEAGLRPAALIMERHVQTAAATISYSIDGAADTPTLLFINSIATTRELWSRQVAALAESHRLITYDARGHGRSSVPSGAYTIERLGRDALAILDAEGVASAHVCGISLGGITAMWLGVHAPDRVRSLTLANTSARIGSVEMWSERITLVREKGMAALAELTIPRWFTEAFRAREPKTIAQFRAMVAACPPEGYLGCCAALRDEDLRDAVGSIRRPVLAIAGRADVATPAEALQFVHERIAGSTLVMIESAHLSNVECAEEFNAALAGFLASG
jgi:3-oxoadipate enol-lactonase